MLIPGMTDNAKTGAAKGLLSGDDTFRNMLREKVSERKNHMLQPQHVDRKVSFTNNRVSNRETGAVNGKKPEPVKTKPGKGLKDIVEASVQETEDTKNDEKKAGELMDSLEALIALLEEILARLNSNNVPDVVYETSNISQELTQRVETKEISTMEQLMAMVKEDAVTLKEIMNEWGNSINSINTPENSQLLAKIQDLLGKLADDRNMPLLKARIVDESVGMEELMEQLKNQCRQLIGKFNEQVSQPDISQNEESVQAEQVLSGSVKAEPESWHDAKDAEGDFSVSDEDTDASQVNTYADTDNYFENVIAQNRQIPEGRPVQPEVTEKLQLPLSEKPLANTITNQVVTKIKLLAGENKQEMEMHLKPESLGRLTLKIIHERGEILARITAENQQVKAILENNMQMLKDALERNGLNVQDLSVSVGNDRDNQHSKESQDDRGKADLAGLRRISGVPSQTETDKLRLRARIEKEYFKDTSQINLTA